MSILSDAGLRRYLLDGERVVVAVRRHWVQLLEPSLSAAAGLALTLWVEATVRPGAVVLARLAWWAWFVLVARLVWYAVRWRLDWFVATDKRLVLTQGVVTRKVAMMPLAKVTDMSFVQSISGRLLGYGKFIMESAGHEQALREVNWIPDAAHTYRMICAEMFGVEDHDRVSAQPVAETDAGRGSWSDRPRASGRRQLRPGRSGSPSGPVHRPASQPGPPQPYRPVNEPEVYRAPDTGPVIYHPRD